MQEWLNWTVSKTVVAQVTVGSNPTLSVFSLNNRTQKDFAVVKCLSFAACGAVAQLGECIPRTDEVTGSNPVCSIFNFTLQLNCGRWNYRIRCLNSPAPLLLATVWFDAKTV